MDTTLLKATLDVFQNTRNHEMLYLFTNYDTISKQIFVTYHTPHRPMNSSKNNKGLQMSFPVS